MNDSESCPTPWKVAHWSAESAQGQARGLRAKSKAPAACVYKCICGAWHVSGNRKRRVLN